MSYKLHLPLPSYDMNITCRQIDLLFVWYLGISVRTDDISRCTDMNQCKKNMLGTDFCWEKLRCTCLFRPVIFDVVSVHVLQKAVMQNMKNAWEIPGSVYASLSMNNTSLGFKIE